ncbi:MAG: serine esterase [Bdellovibrionaceae bacterium]|nr:serine esterase [Pseudobdellovibrionaceae bacterium]
MDFQTDLFKSRFLQSSRKSDQLMLVLHGRGDSLRPFSRFNEELRIPEMNYLLLNAPKKYLDGYSWYGEPPYKKQGVLRIRELLFQLIEQLEMQGWKSENIFLFGFSQGCLVSADFALNSKKKLAGVIGVSGYFHFFPRWRAELSREAAKTPWLITHGLKDDVLKIDDTKFGVNKLKNAGLHIDWIELSKEHTMEHKEYPIIRKWVREKLK